MGWRCWNFRPCQHGKYGMIEMDLNLAKFPFLRIAIPFIIGILTFAFDMNIFIPISLLAIGIITLLFLRIYCNNKLRYKYHYLYTPSFIAIFLAIGWFCAFINKPNTLPSKTLDKEMFFTARVKSIKQKNITTEVVTESQDLTGKPINILMTIEGNNYKIRNGDILYCYSTLEPIKSSNNPESFDYAAYMRNNGILYRSFVKRNDLQIIGYRESLGAKAAAAKDNLTTSIQNVGFSDNTTNFLITILTGDNGFINPEIRELYSKSGLAHILAISGLHIAIIAWIISILLKPLDYANLKKLRFILTLIIIWIFTYITGLSPSATRAAIMTSFVITSFILHKKYNILNSLSCSAVFILLANPYTVYNIGFQLSYGAVLGIILFADKITFGKRFSLMRKISSIIAVTIAAQIGTVLIIAYYYNAIPSYFLLSNLIVIPLLPIIIGLSIFTIALSSFGINVGLTIPIDHLYEFILSLSTWIDKWNYSSIEFIWIDGLSTILLLFAILTIGIWFNRKNSSSFLLYISSLLILSGCTSMILQRVHLDKSGFFISDEYTSTNIVYFNGEKAYIANSKNDSTEINSFIEKNQRFFIKHRIKYPVKLETKLQSDGIYYNHPYLWLRGIKLAFADNNIKKYKPTDKIQLDYLILTSKYYGNLSMLIQHFEFKTIIVTNELFPSKREALLSELKDTNCNIVDIEDSPLYIKFQ